MGTKCLIFGQMAAGQWEVIYVSLLPYFQATDVNLAAHIRRNEDWAPKNESLSTSVAGLAADSFYEVCLAVIDQSTVYYVHRSNCREVRTLSVSEKNHMVEGEKKGA